VRKNGRERHNKYNQTAGFTLLEILIATVILLVGITAIFHTTRAALQRMTAARELTEVQNACQAVLNELLAQSSPIQPDAGKMIKDLPHWRIRVDVYPATQPGLYVLHLSAQEFSSIDGLLIGIRYQLIRWIPAERVGF
jgi:prepilin-type N-terminal cleavage/methylation domain-containing protein